jgi:hypothetical protein
MSTQRINNPKAAAGTWAYIDLTLTARLSVGALPVYWKPFGPGVTRDNHVVFYGNSGVITFAVTLVKADMAVDSKRGWVAVPGNAVSFDAVEFDYVYNKPGEIVIDHPRLGAHHQPLPVGVQPSWFHRNTQPGRAATAAVQFVLKPKNPGMLIKIGNSVGSIGDTDPITGQGWNVSSDGSDVVTPSFRLDLEPVPAPEPKLPKDLLQTKVFFKLEGSAMVSNEMRVKLSHWKNKLRQASDPLWRALDTGKVPVRLYGYATDTSTEAKNLKLADDRNNNVIKELKALGFNRFEREALGIVRIDVATRHQRRVAKGAIDAERYVQVFIDEKEAKDALAQ